MGPIEIELPDGMEAQINSHVDEQPPSPGKSEFVRDAIRRLLAFDGRPRFRSGIYVSQQQIESVEAVSLEDVNAEQAAGSD